MYIFTFQNEGSSYLALNVSYEVSVMINEKCGIMLSLLKSRRGSCELNCHLSSLDVQCP